MHAQQTDNIILRHIVIFPQIPQAAVVHAATSFMDFIIDRIQQLMYPDVENTSYVVFRNLQEHLRSKALDTSVTTTAADGILKTS